MLYSSPNRATIHDSFSILAITIQPLRYEMRSEESREHTKLSSITEQKAPEPKKTSEHEVAPKSNFINRIIYFYTVIAIISGVAFTAWSNPEIFKLRPDTLSIITEFYNALVTLLVPFLLGTIAAFARILMSGMKAAKNIPIIFSSGLMASFSWLSLKSKVFLALVTPYIVHTQPNQAQITTNGTDIGSEFYSMALVAVLVGMFASNIYIAISQRVEKLTNERIRQP